MTPGPYFGHYGSSCITGRQHVELSRRPIALGRASPLPACRLLRGEPAYFLPGAGRHKSYSITTLDTSTFGAGHWGAISSRACLMVSATTRLRYHFRLAGMTCHGAATVLQRDNASSNALM